MLSVFFQQNRWREQKWRKDIEFGKPRNQGEKRNENKKGKSQKITCLNTPLFNR